MPTKSNLKSNIGGTPFPNLMSKMNIRDVTEYYLQVVYIYN